LAFSSAKILYDRAGELSKMKWRNSMRKLWVKAWMTFDGVFDADTMGHWWQNTNTPERMEYIMEQYSQGDG
jgi:hypothetical protein